VDEQPEEKVTVALTKIAWQQIVNLLDQERNVVKAMPRTTGPLASTLNYMQDGVVLGMTVVIDDICEQAGVLPDQPTRKE